MKPEMGVAKPEARWAASRSATVSELAFGGLTTALITWSLVVIVLAQSGLFRAWLLLVAALFAAAVGLAFCWIQRTTVDRARAASLSLWR